MSKNEKSVGLSRVGEDIKAVALHRPLTRDNLRDEIWQTIQDVRNGVISVLNAAVVSRLAHELMKTYRVMPDLED